MKRAIERPDVPVLALDAKQTAQALSIGERTVYDLWASGKLPYRVVAGKRRTYLPDLHRWLESQPTQTAAIDDAEQELLNEGIH